MKKSNGKNLHLVTIIFLLNSSIFISDTISQWVLVGNGLANTTFTSLTANTNTIFAGAMNSRVYLTTNNGANWTESLVISSYVYSLASSGNNIFAGGDISGVYYSSNNGTSWSPTSLPGLTVNSLAVNSNFVFAGASQNNGVYRSSNNGTNWTQTLLNNRSVNALTVKGDTVFAGTAFYGVYLSIDNGSTWSQTSLNNLHIQSLAVNGNNVFAGTSGNGIYLSTNNGTNWTQIGLNNQSVWAFAFYENTIFAGSYTTGVYVSHDNGATWIPKSEGLPGGLNIRALRILDNYIFTTPQSRVYRRPIGELTGFQPVSNEIPVQFMLSQNYPNPFNPVTNIKFSIPLLSTTPLGRGVSAEGRQLVTPGREGVFVTLNIYDALGRKIETLVNSELSPGTYKVEWNAANFSTGVYFYNIKTNSFTETRKMILIK